MDIFAALHSRRSIRQYTSQKVDAADIRTMLDAAMAAPSAGNAQPWAFVVVEDPALLSRIPDIHPYAGMAARAPLAVLVCGDLKAEKYPGFWVQDCSAAVQNLLLAAVGLGLGAVWTGIYPLEDRVARFNELFSLPEHIVPLALVVAGHTETRPEKKSRYDASRICHNNWGRQWPGA